METGDSRTLNCSVVAIDHFNYCYSVCSLCEKTLTPDNNNVNLNDHTSSSSSSSSICNHCHLKNPSSSGPKRLFRVLVSFIYMGLILCMCIRICLLLTWFPIFFKLDCDINV